jgi:hypothetical protein
VIEATFSKSGAISEEVNMFISRVGILHFVSLAFELNGLEPAYSGRSVTFKNKDYFGMFVAFISLG